MNPGDISPEIIAELCLQKYKELPKTGKPTDEQWSVLAGIVLYNAATKNKRVVSLGLGTKCIGAGKMCKNGFIINDSHAEVLARRAFLRYVYNELKAANLQKESIFVWNCDSLTYDLKPAHTFHFFCTQPPCGDACIIENIPEVPPNKRQKLDDDATCGVGELLSSATVYTGAKLFDKICTNDDCMAQTIGALRIKPGKGDRTLSMSCSDKISKWCFLGIQGALLDCLLTTPIYIETFSFCENADVAALQRAIYERWKCKPSGTNFALQRYEQHVPKIQVCTKKFDCEKSAKRNQSSPAGIAWCDIPKTSKPCEVLVDGRRQGCTKKSIGTAQAAVQISKYHLFMQFLQLLAANQSLKQRCLQASAELDSLSYRRTKNLSITYQKAWAFIKANYFGHWTKKPAHLEDFWH